MPSIKRRLKEFAKPRLLDLHKAMLRFGLIVLPNHYYTPIADLRHLRRTRKHWAKRAPLHAVDTDPERQLAWLERHVQPFEPEFRGNPRYLEGVAAEYGPGFGYIEAQCLHGAIRGLKPKRIVEVGSGVSTYVMLGALGRNAAEGHPGTITCIEPHPSAFLRGSAEIEMIPSFVEQVDPAMFDVLEAGDMLFIDSTHAVRPGGDVQFLYLWVIPRLKPGVLIHIHDIYLPYLHQRAVLSALFQWQETALLAALLTGNSHLAIECCLSQLHYDRPGALQRVFPEYRPAPGEDGLAPENAEGHFPSSIYLAIR